MRKITTILIILLFVIIIFPNNIFANNTNLIKDEKLEYAHNLNNNGTSRAIVSFTITEDINLSKGKTDIITEFFIKDDTGNLIDINNTSTGKALQKDKSWPGYLNTYIDYPNGEIKYSSGNGSNTNYTDKIGTHTNISTQISSSNSYIGLNWTSSQIFATRITVLRENGSGERIMVYSDGTSSVLEKIEKPVEDKNEETGIVLQATTGELPEDTKLVVDEITTGKLYNNIGNILESIANNFYAYKINLSSRGEIIQPNGKVKINIPIPEDLDTSNLAVYRILEDASNIEYGVALEEIDGVEHAGFETEHFSTYILAQKEIQAEKDETPNTGTSKIVYYAILINTISIIVIVSINNKINRTNER